MPTYDQRLLVVEGQVQEHARTLEDVREAIRVLQARMEHGFEAIDRRFEQVDRRFEQVERRFEQVERRFEGFELRFQGVERRLDRLDDKVSRQFMWIVGIQVTTLVAIVAALVAR